jgi:hypothetical protein
MGMQSVGRPSVLTKAYALPFFLVHFTLTTALHWFEMRDGSSRRELLKNFVAGLIVFGAFTAPWVYLISSKYGKFTVGTTGDYNYRIGGPMSLAHPHYDYLIPPPSEDAASSWDQPDPARVPAWSPIANSLNLRHQLKLVWNNTKEMMRYERATSLLIPTILLAYVVIGLCRVGASNLIPWFLALVTILMYPVPYLLVIVMDRYLWLPDLICLLMGVSVLSYIIAAGGLSKVARTFLLVVFCGSFLVLPLRMLKQYFNASKQDYNLAQTVAAQYGIRGRIASCGDFIDSLYFAYQLHLPYYGSTGKAADEDAIGEYYNPDYVRAKALAPPPRSESDIERQLDENKIDYYLVWTGKSAPIPSFVQNLEDITHGEMPQLRIYRWKRR